MGGSANLFRCVYLRGPNVKEICVDAVPEVFWHSPQTRGCKQTCSVGH